MTVSLGVLYFSLVLARVAAFVTAFPFFGGQNVPRLVKSTLALVLAILFFGSVFNTLPPSDWFERPSPAPWLTYGIALIREAILGALFGFAFSLFMAPVRIAGEYITQEMGLTLGNLVSSTSDTPIGPLTQILEILAALIFLGLDGHHMLLTALYGTFQHYPLGAPLPTLPVPQMVRQVSMVQEWGLLLAAPVGLCLFLTTVVLGLMMRAAPQLNLYTIGFPLRIGAGLAALLLLAPNLAANMVKYFGRIGEWLLWLR